MSYRFSCHRCGFHTRWRFLVWLHDRQCRFPGHSWEPAKDAEKEQADG